MEFLHYANRARTHAYDLLGLYRKDKHSTLVSDLVWNVSSTWYVVDTKACYSAHAFSANIGFVLKRKVPQGE